METDSFFFQLFKQLPQTLFELLGQPGELAKAYQFESVELKKSLRIDGLFLPKKPDLPVYFVEVQFHRSAAFYANLFAKVFLFLEANPTVPDWVAVALFENRSVEPKHLVPYEDLLHSKRVTRIYLDGLPILANPPIGMSILQMVTAPENDIKRLVDRLVGQAGQNLDSSAAKKTVELVEELLIRRFTELDREEIRKMFHLQDIRKSKVWQEANQEGKEEGKEEGYRELIQKLLAKGMSVKEIADLAGMPVKEVRRLSKGPGK